MADTSELGRVLGQLELSKYEGTLRENGFETWDDVTAITEPDLIELRFKLGDRRKLQRGIREYSGSFASESGYRIRNAPPSYQHVRDPSDMTGPNSPQTTRTTRPYRRHARPDPNAPPKPKTAYVLFGEHVRQDPALSGTPFADLAKETGKRWRELSSEERVDVWERPAAEKLREYREEYELYKQTENYRRYQAYLEGFRQRHRKPDSTGPVDDRASSASENAPLRQPSVPQYSHEEWDAPQQQEWEPPAGEDVEMEDPETEGDTEESPVKSGMSEVRQVSRALGVNPHLTRISAFPPGDMTMRAVEAFLHGTGSLLFLWDHGEAKDLVRSVYSHDAEVTHAPEVFAMAAVGSYCDGEHLSIGFRETFLHHFLYMLSTTTDVSNLRRMRLFACLAICRFTNSVKSARRLMLSALGIGREIFSSASFKAEKSDEDARYWWNVFRSIIFLESWFAYNTGHDSRIMQEDLNLYHPPPSRGESSVRFAKHVGDLGQIAAYISLSLKSATQPRVEQANVHFQSLNEWHRSLPPPMQLSRLSLADPLDMNWHTKRSLLQLHILFLGLFIEPYRNCLVDLGKVRLDLEAIDPKELEKMKQIEEQCVLAARQSSRVASLLQSDDLIRSHCWVSVYTSFTGCAVLLFSASQNLLQLSAEEVGQELSYASSHLNLLSYCSFDNALAKILYAKLHVIYNDIREALVSSAYRDMRQTGALVRDAVLVPPSEFGSVEGTMDISRTMVDLNKRILEVLCESLNF